MHALATLINDGDPALLALFIDRFEPRLAFPALVKSSFGKPTRMSRLEGVLLALQEYAYGADTEAAVPLAAELLNYFKQYWHELPTDNRYLPHLFASTLNCAIYANFQEGNWDHALAILKEPVREYPWLTKESMFWNAIGIHARILVRRNEAKEASTLLDATPKELWDKDNQVETARNELRSFEQRRLEVDNRPTTAQQTAAIWMRVIPEMRANMLNLRKADIGRAATASAAPLTPFLDAVIRDLEESERLIHFDMPFERKRVVMAEAMYEFQEALRRYQSPRGDLARLNYDWVSRCFHRVAALHGATTLSSEADPLLEELSQAASWASRARDQHSLWLVTWSKLLIFEEIGRAGAVAECVRSLLQSLKKARAEAADIDVKSDIANFFPDLPRKTLRFGARCLVKSIADACELRRGRSRLDAKADPSGAVRLANAGSAALGQRTHYLGFTALHSAREIHAILYHPDGTVLHEQVKLDLDTVYEHAPRLEPKQWRRPNLFHRNASLAPAALSPLLAPLARAMDESRISAGDHVCIAAEDPLHLVPFQYLALNGQMAVHLLSMSRVVSFADAVKIASSPIHKPASAAALFIPPADEKSLTEKQRAFDRAASALGAALPTRRVREQSMTTEIVFEAIRSCEVIHVDAHGTCPFDKNPLDGSGLLVSSGDGPPTRSGSVSQLLSPKRILDSNLSLEGRHLCLNACVSGLGLPGKGGDVLGMEFALRYRGAESVLASHWNVEWSRTSRFFEEYYSRWLGAQLPRNRAWRESILSLIQQPATSDAPENWCAFSLFGDWR